jgi:hypothetical protein
MCAALLHTRQTTENESSAHFSFFLAETLIAFLVGIFLVDFVLFGFFLEEETLCWATEFQ